ncbi:hypothetical protein BDZ91DRAFT_737380 [Kalaharituber pfeilii]|nr:hypothetical protein BDZ91DRAFT_737380 [Kalaharituber pfeilii]
MFYSYYLFYDLFGLALIPRGSAFFFWFYPRIAHTLGMFFNSCFQRPFNSPPATALLFGLELRLSCVHSRVEFYCLLATSFLQTSYSYVYFLSAQGGYYISSFSLASLSVLRRNVVLPTV